MGKYLILDSKLQNTQNFLIKTIFTTCEAAAAGADCGMRDDGRPKSIAERMRKLNSRSF